MLASTANYSALFADWTLIIFTVFAQFAAGSALFATVAQSSNEQTIAKKFYFTSFILMSIAGIVSLLHLQNPFNAFYTITQVGHSWLSREILTVGFFTGLVFLQLILSNKCLSYLTSFAGLTLVYVISQVYASVDSMPFWANKGTIIAFYGTCLLLGGALALLLGKSKEEGAYKGLALAAIAIGLICSLFAKLVWISVFMKEEVLSIPLEFNSALCFLALQLGLLLLGFLIVLCKKARNSGCLLSLALLFFLFAELSSRSLFFIAQLKIGV